MARRWGKLEKDFKLREDRPEFDMSKIPDIYDCIKYDVQHNQAAIKYDDPFLLNYFKNPYLSYCIDSIKPKSSTCL